MTDIAMIDAAAARLHGHARRTPLLSSPFLDEIAGRRVLVKAECLQHTGSFKFRGAWSAVSALPQAQRATGVIAYSSGNHAQGVALAARQHGIPAVIVMPEDAPRVKTRMPAPALPAASANSAERRPDEGTAGRTLRKAEPEDFISPARSDGSRSWTAYVPRATDK